ncbi:hypothetical protein OnM2_047073 [Erysiphe neolycopersici]|uniref:Uncharacterized protein n=1 Tax=Erysiphe neolycopersici TaxID=212602 RepID=A0A420HU09_9PEZI|nr:hypothetical protein OnM2_047073 [Erysiphe neolycopersici]
MAMDLSDLDYSTLRVTDPIVMANESKLRCNEMRNLLEEMRIRENSRITEIESIRSYMKELLTLMQSKIVEDKNQPLTQTATPAFIHEYPESSGSPKIETNKMARTIHS